MVLQRQVEAAQEGRATFEGAGQRERDGQVVQHGPVLQRWRREYQAAGRVTCVHTLRSFRLAKSTGTT